MGPFPQLKLLNNGESGKPTPAVDREDIVSQARKSEHEEETPDLWYTPRDSNPEPTDQESETDPTSSALLEQLDRIWRVRVCQEMSGWEVPDQGVSLIHFSNRVSGMLTLAELHILTRVTRKGGEKESGFPDTFLVFQVFQPCFLRNMWLPQIV